MNGKEINRRSCRRSFFIFVGWCPQSFPSISRSRFGAMKRSVARRKDEWEKKQILPTFNFPLPSADFLVNSLPGDGCCSTRSSRPPCFPPDPVCDRLCGLFEIGARMSNLKLGRLAHFHRFLFGQFRWSKWLDRKLSLQSSQRATPHNATPAWLPMRLYRHNKWYLGIAAISNRNARHASVGLLRQVRHHQILRISCRETNLADKLGKEETSCHRQRSSFLLLWEKYQAISPRQTTWDHSEMRFLSPSA